MRSHRVVTGLIGILVLIATAACTPIEEIPQETATTSPSPAAPAAAVPAPAPAGNTGSTLFEEPVVAPASPGIQGLAPMVNPVERLKQIRAGRADPFVTTQTVGIRVSVTQPPPPPELTLPPGTSPPGTSPNDSTGPGGTTAPIPPPFPSPGISSTDGGPGRIATLPTVPPVPQPDLARAVEVTGVIQVGDVPRAIIQAPNEATSRYVIAGQRVANGRVLVKRIDATQFPSPVVVLEEKGIEVIKAVGEGAADAEVTTTG
ncbi:hypothetical protein [Trichothermofontia sp.]